MKEINVGPTAVYPKLLPFSKKLECVVCESSNIRAERTSYCHFMAGIYCTFVNETCNTCGYEWKEELPEKNN